MQVDFVLDYDTLTLHRQQRIHLLLRVMGSASSAEHTRRPLNLGLVIDRSGSMAGRKIDFTRQAAQVLVQNLGLSDTLSIVTYSDEVEVLLPPEPVQRKDIINQRINTIQPGGTTNLSGGWLEACKLVAENLDGDHLNRVILMTDGLANRGVTDSGRLVKMAQQKLGAGIATTTMGLGDDFNEDLLMAMASAGGGAFYFIDSPEVAPAIFNEELQGLLNVVGQNLSVSFEPLAGFDLHTQQMNAYPAQADGSRQVFRLGDLFADEVKALLLEIDVPPQSSAGRLQIARLRIEYDELLPGSTQHHVQELPVMVGVRPVDSSPLLVNPEVSQSVLLLQAAQARQQAIIAADRGDFLSATHILRTAAASIDDGQAPHLLQERSALNREADSLEAGPAAYNAHSRKFMSTQAFYTMSGRHDETMELRQRQEGGAVGGLLIDKRPGVAPTHVNWRDRNFPLDGDLIRIGRSSENEITVNVKGVSRFHCQIVRDGDQLLLQDLGSTNGTLLDGRPTQQPLPISVGDVAYVCDEKLIFHDGSL